MDDGPCAARFGAILVAETLIVGCRGRRGETFVRQPAIPDDFSFAMTTVGVADPAAAAYYRTQTGVKMDLVLTVRGETIGVEVKPTTAPKLEKGLRSAIADVGCTRTYVVIPSGERFRMAEGVEAIPVAPFVREVVEPLRAG